MIKVYKTNNPKYLSFLTININTGEYIVFNEYNEYINDDKMHYDLDGINELIQSDIPGYELLSEYESFDEYKHYLMDNFPEECI